MPGVKYILNLFLIKPDVLIGDFKPYENFKIFTFPLILNLRIIGMDQELALRYWLSEIFSPGNHYNRGRQPNRGWYRQNPNG